MSSIYSPAQETREMLLHSVQLGRLNNTNGTATTFGFRPKFACTITSIEGVVDATTSGTGTISMSLADGPNASGSVMLTVSSTADNTFVSDTSLATTGNYATFIPRNGQAAISIATTAAGDTVWGLSCNVYGKPYPSLDS